MYKTCTKCKEQKLFTDFHKDKSKQDGYRTTCKTCKSNSDYNYKKNNSEKCKVRDADYHSRNKDIRNLQSKIYYEENKEKLLLWQKEYNLERRDFVLQYLRDRHNTVKYTEEYRKKYKEYYETNKEFFIGRAAKRRAAKLKALPKWLTPEQLEQIKELYTCAQMFKLYTGEEYHVDHIVPLQGENVCGLHVPWNLQVIPAKENLSKSNKLQEDIL
jgi:hypothetical protein